MGWSIGEIEERLGEIHDDFEANVIGHKVDRDVLFAVDLAYHSVSAFEFQGRYQKKGMLEVLIVGDTRIGKTKSAECLIEHFRRGELVECGNVSLSGLFGGIDDMGERNRFAKAGILPLRHGELVVLDESNEISQELIGTLSGVRSSGVYQIVKIVQAKIPCKLRLIWIANPRGDLSIGEYNYGVEVVSEVIGKAEDIARFDLAVVLGSRDVDRKALYVSSEVKPKVVEVWNGELCRSLIDWAWSRKADQVVISPATERVILDWSEDFSKKYSPKVPLVIETEQRIKIARLAIACAARLGSTDESCERVVVLPNHVHAVCKRVQRIYNRSSMLYDRYSESRSAKVLGPHVDRVINALGNDGVSALLKVRFVSKSLVQDLLSDKEAGSRAWSDLLTGQALMNNGRGYQMTESLIDKIKLERSTLPKRPNADLLKMV